MKLRFWRKDPKPEPHEFRADLTGDNIVVLASSATQQSVIIQKLNVAARLRVSEALGLTKDYIIDGNPTVRWINSAVSGYTYPDDFSNYGDYLEAFLLVPKVARALELKNLYLWQAGYDLEVEEEGEPQKDKDGKIIKDPGGLQPAASKALAGIEADREFMLGTLWARVFGNYYWLIDRKGGKVKLRPLNPMGIGVKVNKDTGEITEYGFKASPTAEVKPLSPKDVLHLRVNPSPWGPFGRGDISKVIIVVKQIAYMEKYLPEIARQRADPWLHFTIQDPQTKMPLPEPSYKKIKAAVLERQPGQNLITDPGLEVNEVYQAAQVGGRQTLEGILEGFYEQLHAGLGLPEVYMSAGGTTLKGTAEHQETGLESETRGDQREIKRFHEHQLWPLLGISDKVSMVWRPLKPEDKDKLSIRLRAEVADTFITKALARQLLGYPELGDQPVDPLDEAAEEEAKAEAEAERNAKFGAPGKPEEPPK